MANKLKKILFFPALFLLIFSKISLGQSVIPDYNERAFAGLQPDSAYAASITLQATEGSVDPDEYIVGPGDKLFISISGVEEYTMALTVNQEGILYIPKVGGVNLKNTSLAESKEKIISVVNRYYKNVDIFISLVDFRKIKVAFIGNVVKPSTYVLAGNARLLDLITISSGLKEDANYRNVIIKNRSGEENSFDILSFLRYGERENNPILKEGDVVVIDKVDKVVHVSGSIKYPGTYEFVEDETVYDLLMLAGGTLDKARLDSIEIVRFDETGARQQSFYYTIDELKNLTLEKYDHLIVREKPEYLVGRYVSIAGYVKYPGYYKIIKDETTLSEVIKQAGGLKKDASLTEAALIRNIGVDENDPEYERLKTIPRQDMTDDEYDYLKSKSRQRKGKVVVDFQKLMNGDSSEDVILKRGDAINIPEEKNYIIMLGQVTNPGNIIFQENLTIEDYIELAGGFGWRALEGDVRVIKAHTGEWVEADEIEKLEPGDTIWVPEDPPGPKFWDVFTSSLTILGQVAAIVAATVAVIISTR